MTSVAVALAGRSRTKRNHLMATQLHRPLCRGDVSKMLRQSRGKGIDSALPSRADVVAVIPPECFERNLLTSMGYLMMSVGLTALLSGAAYTLLPLEWWALPLWAIYAAACGTVATGTWIIAHECGHNAFSEYRWLDDFLGFIIHTSFLVPYFSVQRTHAVHHAFTNHMERGHTGVPRVRGDGSKREQLYNEMEEQDFLALNLFNHLALGWPFYLVIGVNSGAAYGTMSHFWPEAPIGEGGSVDVFPGPWKQKVIVSALGVFAMLALLAYWASQAGLAQVIALYGGPYLVVNFWVVAVNWMHHTHPELPHYGKEDFTWVKGAFGTVDRDWGWLLDVLFHRVTSTHTVHHFCDQIPHYHAPRATDALRSAYPDLCVRDDTPFWQALLKTARSCIVVEKVEGTKSTYRYTH